MKPTQAKFQIGKNGLTDSFIETIKTAFKTRKQVRISVLKSGRTETPKALAEKIQATLPFKTNSRVIGFTIILLKTNK